MSIAIIGLLVALKLKDVEIQNTKQLVEAGEHAYNLVKERIKEKCPDYWPLSDK